jgi:hypothetical protein
MTKNYQQLIDVINHSVHQKEYHQKLNEDDFMTLRYNQLSGICYPILKNQDQNVMEKFKYEYFLYVKRHEAQMTLIHEIRHLFNEHQIDFVFLKGSFLKTIYPYPYMRVMGDIDVLIKDVDMDLAHQVLKDHGYRNWSNSINHDCFAKSRINVEIHPKLDSNFDQAYQPLFLNAWDHVNHHQDHEYMLHIEYNLFYQIYHMIKHLYHSGVGYRSIVDLYIFLKKYQNEFDLDRYKFLYDLFPKKDFINYILHVMQSLYKELNIEKFIINKDPLSKPIEPFINYLFKSGTHGVSKEHQMFIGQIAHKKKDHESNMRFKFKFLLSKVFLNLDTMRGTYKYLNRFPFLLPFAWIQRMFRLLFRKQSRKKLKYLSVDNQEILMVKKLFTDVGI